MIKGTGMMRSEAGAMGLPRAHGREPVRNMDARG